MTLPQGWSEITLGSLTTLITSGSRGWAKFYTESGSYFIRVQNIQRRSVQLDLVDAQFVSVPRDSEGARTKIQIGDILVTITADLGRIGFVSGEINAYVNQHVALVRMRDVQHASFIAHYLRSEEAQKQLGLRDRGVTRAGLGLEDLRALSIPIPPLAEQRRIISKVSMLTERIARARAELSRAAPSHDRLRTTVLRQAVTGALTQTWREQAPELETVTKLLDRTPTPLQGRGGREATDKIIPGRGGLSVNDPGSTLPFGWQWVSLLRLAKQETGHTPSRSQPSYWDGDVPWVGIRDAGAHHGRRIDETAQTISDAGLANSSARLLPAGTVCLSRTASVGYVTILGRPMATSQDFATWTCGSALLPEYLMLALLAEGDDIRKFGMGSTHTTIYFPEIRALYIALPPLDEQREIVARTEAAFARATRLEAEAARATALLDRLETSILTKAFRGKLVPQDPADEPASALLDRKRAVAPRVERGRGAVGHAEAR